MNDELSWWQQMSPTFLDETLPFINSSRSRDEAIGRCDDLCKALNATWKAFFRYRRKGGQLNAEELANEAEGQPSDNQSFRELMLRGFGDQQILSICRSESVRCLAEFKPQIMSHDILRKREYDPSNITEDIQKEAIDRHRQLLNAYQRYSGSPDEPKLKEPLLKKIAQLLYIVRSNIAHSEKTPKGPDLSKSERDRVVSEVTGNLIEDVFDILFDGPSRRLAVYGTLAPDKPNASELAGLDGKWHDGTVSGVVKQRDGLSEFYWLLNEGPIPVKVLSASCLKDRFDKLDQFEGPRYQRILVPVLIDEKVCVSNIYEGKHAKLNARLRPAT